MSFGITYERDDWWAPASRFTRNIGNLLHYRRRNYADCPALTERAERRAGHVARFALPRFLSRFPLLVEGLSAIRQIPRWWTSGEPRDRRRAEGDAA